MRRTRSISAVARATTAACSAGFGGRDCSVCTKVQPVARGKQPDVSREFLSGLRSFQLTGFGNYTCQESPTSLSRIELATNDLPESWKPGE